MCASDVVGTTRQVTVQGCTVGRCARFVLAEQRQFDAFAVGTQGANLGLGEPVGIGENFAVDGVEVGVPGVGGVVVEAHG